MAVSEFRLKCTAMGGMSKMLQDISSQNGRVARSIPITGQTESIYALRNLAQSAGARRSQADAADKKCVTFQFHDIS